jgi:hypothetical protein
MPYKVKKQGDKYVVYKKDTGKRVGSTAGNKEALRKYLAALAINTNENKNNMKLKSILEEDDNALYQNKLKQIFKQNYPGFVSGLGKFATDPKFRQFVKDSDVTKSTVKLTAIPVTALIPTQNEIDVDKSLAFPLTKADAAAYALKGGSVKVAAPIIVFNGKYVIDGHHRWSQLYAINKDAKIVAYNFTNPDIENPLDALKITQVAIVAAGASKIPSQSVKGKNLLKMAEADLKQYVINTIKDPAVEDAFKKAKQLENKESIANYIWENVSSMQSTSQPVPGAPGRGVMPQADDVPGGQKNTVAQLQQGVPALAERKLREAVRRELRKILGK